MRAFVLAGGFATRLWPLTEKRAKPLLPVAGKPVIEYLVEKIPNDIPVTVSTNAMFGRQFEEWVATLERHDIHVMIEDTSHDDHKLGALGATREWIQKEQIDDDILLLTGDNYLGFAMETFLRAYQDGVPLLAAYDIGDRAKASSFGTVLTDARDPSVIVGFEEKPREPKTSLVSTGCCVIPKSDLPTLLRYAEQHPDNVGGIFEEFLRTGTHVRCFTFSEPWIDIGSFGSYLEAHRILIGEKALVDASSTMTDTETEGTVYVDAGSTVTHSRLTDCVIFPGCRIRNCVLRECVVDADCNLQDVDLTRQMVRSGTRLAGDLPPWQSATPM